MIPPVNVDAERALLGSLLRHGTVRDLTVVARPDQFLTLAHQDIFAAALRVHARGDAVGTITVAEELRRVDRLDATGGQPMLALMAEEASEPVYQASYEKIVADLALKRRYGDLGERLMRGAQNGASAADLLAACDEVTTAHRGQVAQPAASPVAIGLGDFFAALKDAPDPAPLIEGILSADGSGWIAGEEKLGKTPYALEESVSLALGADVCGRFKVPARQRVLFFCEEDTARRAYKRLRALIRGKGLEPGDPRLDLNEWFRLAVWSGIKLDDPLMLARVDAEHEAFRPVVTYYDSLRKIQRLDLNKTFQAEAFLDTLDGLRRKYGTLARVIAHNRKVAAGGFRTGRGSQEIAGSHVLGAWGECSLFFEPIGRKAGAVRVTVQAKDWAPLDPFRLVIESTGPAATPDTMTLRAEDDQGEDAEERVVDAIATLPPVPALTGAPGVPKAAIAASLKCSERTVQRSLTKLEGSGRISVTGEMSKKRPLYGVSSQ